MQPAGTSLTSADRPPPARSRPPWHASAWFDIALCLLLAFAVVALVLKGAAAMGYAWRWDRVPRYLYRVVDGEFIPGPLLKGLLVTLDLSWISMLLALAIGLGTAVLKLSDSVAGRLLASAYVELIRNTPILVQVLIVYFIIGRIFDIPRFWCGVLCLSLYEGAFAAEIIRGAIVAGAQGTVGGRGQPRPHALRHLPRHRAAAGGAADDAARSPASWSIWSSIRRSSA